MPQAPDVIDFSHGGSKYPISNNTRVLLDGVFVFVVREMYKVRCLCDMLVQY